MIGVQAGVQARRRFLICAAACGVFGGLYAASGTYQSEMAEWRKHREAALLADGGWLTVTGLFWLHEGANRFGSEAVNEIVLPNDPALKGGGAFDLDHGKVVLRMDGQSRELHADSMESRDVVTLGSLSLFVIRRGDRYGIRLKDRLPEAVQKYQRLTGYRETNANAIWHHKLSLYGAPCKQCGRPLRTPDAKKCGSCMAPVEASV